MFKFLSFLMPKLFFGLDGAPDGGGESSNEAPTESQSSENTGSQKQETEKQENTKPDPTHDEEGNSYYKRFNEVNEKFKDVDPERYRELSDLDLEEINQNRELIASLKKAGILDKVTDLIKGSKNEEDGSKKQSEKGEFRDPRVDKIIEEQEKRDRESAKQQLLETYDSDLKEVMTKEKMSKLTRSEETYVKKAVFEVFAKAGREGRQMKLGQMKNLVEKAIKDVIDDRRDLDSSRVREDGDRGPDGMRQKGEGRPAPKRLEKNERQAAFAQDLAAALKT